MRLAFASFGVNTPVLSVVLSVFMAGLALGSWAGGNLAGHGTRSSFRTPLFFYALCETLIGVGAFAVPFLFWQGERILLSRGAADSLPYLLLSALAILLSLLPWTLCMGATFPLIMAFLRKTGSSSDGFSFLYTANVAGAMAGVAVTALILIEKLGFHQTLYFGAGLNFLVAAVCFALGLRSWGFASNPASARQAKAPASAGKGSFTLAILFLTGFICMALEVIWTRDFTLVLKTQVYSYASLLFVYLLSTFTGSWLYRNLPASSRPGTRNLLCGALAGALLPVLVDDPRFQSSAGGVLASIVPFCLALGMLTPKLVDEFSSGDPARAGRAYALNTLGCILGPLAASYLFLPWAGVKASLLALALPWVPLIFLHKPGFGRRPGTARALACLGALVLGFLLYSAGDYEREPGRRQPHALFRDYAATVVAVGQGSDSNLYVNGIAMTALLQVTKGMAHLPLAFFQGRPRSGLAICFGMGTTFRSLLSWGIQTTAVELVPGVLKSFWFFHPDADALLRLPQAHLVVDDGRRFLERNPQTYDIITIDPPPPLEAAASSLLYSTEFYELAKSRLNPGGILQQWLPVGDPATWQAASHSLARCFPYLRVFSSTEGFGCHILASLSPIPVLTPRQLARRMPAPAARDLMEWFPADPPEKYFQAVLGREIALSDFVDPRVDARITDDRPVNEYYLLRRWKL